MTEQSTAECPVSSVALDLFHTWLQSNPPQLVNAVTMVVRESAPDSLELLADWVTSLTERGVACWPFPALRFAELMSLSSLRRELKGTVLTERDIAVLYSRLLERVPATVSTPGPKYCSECGTVNPSNAVFCSECGKQLPPDPHAA
jgi:hypothetical protein